MNGDLAIAELFNSVPKYNQEEALGLHTVRANPSDRALSKMARHTVYLGVLGVFLIGPVRFGRPAQI